MAAGAVRCHFFNFKLDLKLLFVFEESRTSRTFREYGVCEYSHRGMAKVKESWAWIDARVEENFPGYHKAVADFSSPYVQLFADLGKVSCNAFHNVKEMVIEKYPTALQTVSAYSTYCKVGREGQSQNR